MSSLICGIMENGANYIDVALSPAGNISDRRLLAFTLDGNIRQLIPGMDGAFRDIQKQ